MQKIFDYALQYPLVIAGLILFFVFLCWISKDVQAWVVRGVVFLLLLVAGYIVFQEFKHLIPSSQEAPAFRDDSLTSEEHAGKKYYKDPVDR